MSLNFKKKKKKSSRINDYTLFHPLSPRYFIFNAYFFFLFFFFNIKQSQQTRKKKKKKKKGKKKKQENKYSGKKIILILYAVLLSAPREIFSIIVSRNNPLTRKIRADDKAFLLSGSEKLPGVPFALPSVVAYERKEREEERGGDKMKKRRKKLEGGKRERKRERERERENKEVWRERPRLSENIGRTRSSEIKEEKINPWSPRSGKLMRIKIQFRRRANLFPNVASSWLEETGSSCCCGGGSKGNGQVYKTRNLHRREGRMSFSMNIRD